MDYAGEIEGFITGVFGPVFDAVGLGAIIAGLVIFVVAWTAFVLIVGRKE